MLPDPRPFLTTEDSKINDFPHPHPLNFFLIIRAPPSKSPPPHPLPCEVDADQPIAMLHIYADKELQPTYLPQPRLSERALFQR